VDYCSWK